MTFTSTILLLGSGELGRELTISAKRFGAKVIACDAYQEAPAMQVADDYEVFSMLDGEALLAAVEKHKPDLIVPEIEAIRTEVLIKLESDGQIVVPSAKAVQLTMNRDAIRDFVVEELGFNTSQYRYATSLHEVEEAGATIGYPCVIKPVMSSSGKGQSKVDDRSGLEAAWKSAVANMRGDRARVIVEEFVDFDYEITLLTVRSKDGVTFCPPIGHYQEQGDYRESWQPAPMSGEALAKAKDMARQVVLELEGKGRGWGLFGVEFFVRGDEVFFSEVSPRPHDTGMVTLVSQRRSEFDLHARAILGFPLCGDELCAPSASAVILADRDSGDFEYEGLDTALEGRPNADLRIFGKPTTRRNRRMGVVLATGKGINEARHTARSAKECVTIRYHDS